MDKEKQRIIEIISVGSELVSWLKEETNSRYITEKLKLAGLSVDYRTVVGDDVDRMEEVFHRALERSDIVFITGGLGPTLDDVTREVMGPLIGRRVVVHADSLAEIRTRYKERNLPWTESASKQSMVLEGAIVLSNEVGHAPGMIVEHQGKRMILLPGVPAELRAIYEAHVHPYLLQMLDISIPLRRTFKVTGLPEAQANDIIKPLIPPNSGINILFTVGAGELLIVMELEAGVEGAEELLETVSGRVKQALGERVFSCRNESLEMVVANLLKRSSWTIATAESCTGGLLADRLTNIPGSSYYFLQGVVAYANEAKISGLGVKKKLILEHGAVSREVAEAMARGIRERSGASVGVGITGIAGPEGGTREKPVGRVYIALAHEKDCLVRKFFFPGGRRDVKIRSTQAALDMIRLYITQGHVDG